MAASLQSISFTFVSHGRSPLGPFGYSTGSSLKDLNPNSKTGSGIFGAQIPPHKTTLTTLVKNPTDQPAELTVTVNEHSASGKAVIPPSKTIPVSVPIPAGVTEISVRYAGSKTLVLLETSTK